LSGKTAAKKRVHICEVRKSCVYALIVFLPELAWAARQYRGKQIICYVSVHNGTDTNLRRV